MCVKSCLCNSCYKKETCSDCSFIETHKAVECHIKGITKCEYFKKKGE
jgi:hypothetical protein